MADSYKILYEGGEAEIEVKKSRFIATTRPVKSEEEAVAFIAEMKKKYWDSRHNCSAFTIGMNHELTRCSDDGEPAQTAGRPMLDVLLGEDIHNMCVVVTRYFGGILLGTGGLLRAYTKAAVSSLENAGIATYEQFTEMSISCSYSDYQRIVFELSRAEAVVDNVDYAEGVTVKFAIKSDNAGMLRDRLYELCAGKTKAEIIGQRFDSN